MRVLVTGSRNWTDRETIRQALAMLPDNTTIIHGGAIGADHIADSVAKNYGFTVEVYKPQYDKYPARIAPLMRNTEMLKEGKPDLVLAFHRSNSRGTADMIAKAEKAGIPVRRYVQLV